MNRNGHKLSNNNLSVHEFLNWKTSTTAILKFLLEYKTTWGKGTGFVCGYGLTTMIIMPHILHDNNVSTNTNPDINY